MKPDEWAHRPGDALEVGVEVVSHARRSSPRRSPRPGASSPGGRVDRPIGGHRRRRRVVGEVEVDGDVGAPPPPPGPVQVFLTVSGGARRRRSAWLRRRRGEEGRSNSAAITNIQKMVRAQATGRRAPSAAGRAVPDIPIRAPVSITISASSPGAPAGLRKPAAGIGIEVSSGWVKFGRSLAAIGDCGWVAKRRSPTLSGSAHGTIPSKPVRARRHGAASRRGRDRADCRSHPDDTLCGWIWSPGRELGPYRRPQSSAPAAAAWPRSTRHTRPPCRATSRSRS